MISFMKRTVLRSHLLCKPSFFFSYASNVEFHKAVLASKIIRIIRKSPLNEYLSSTPFPSLKERIFKEIYNYEQQTKAHEQVVRQAAQQVRKCFEEGVYVPLYMCDQSRNHEQELSFQQINSEKKKMQYPTANFQNQELRIEVINLQETQKEFLQNLKFRKLNFVPTYVITGQIFRTIFELSDYTLLSGQYGADKTYSCILYIILSEMIFRYRHKHWKGVRDVQNLPKEIDFKLPKAIYISINTHSPLNELIHFQNYVSDIIKLHFYEIKDTLKSQNIFTMQPISPFITLSSLYSKKFGICTQFLNDQMNEMSSALRTYNVLRKKCKDVFNKIMIQNKRLQQHQNDPLIFSPIQKLIQQLQSEYKYYSTRLKKALLKRNHTYIFIQTLGSIISYNFFDSIIYLSSVDIQNDNVLAELQLMGSSKQDTISNFKRRLEYPISLRNNISIADTTEMIALNLKKYWQNCETSRSMKNTKKLQEKKVSILNKVKRSLDQIMGQQEFYMILPLATNLYFSNNKEIFGETKQNVQNNKTQQNQLNIPMKQHRQNLIELSYERIKKLEGRDLKDKLTLLLKELQTLSISQMKGKFENFLNRQTGQQKVDKEKLGLFIVLWSYAWKVLRQVKNKSRKYENDQKKLEQRSDLTQLKLKYISIDVFKNLLKSNQIVDSMTQTLFSLERNDILRIYANPILFQQVFQSNKQQFYKNLAKDEGTIFNMIKQNNSDLDILLQRSLIDCVIKLNNGFKIGNKFKFQSLISDVTFDYIHPTPSAFLPIPKPNASNYSKFNFTDSFKTHLKALSLDVQRAYQWNLLLPLKSQLSQKLLDIIQIGIKPDQFDQYNKVIDFVLARDNLSVQSFQIHLFDVTTSKKMVQQKVQNFLVEYENFRDKKKLTIKKNQNQRAIIIHYNVICYDKWDRTCQEYLLQRRKTLEKAKKNLKKNDQTILKALSSYAFKTQDGICQIRAAKKRQRINLKSLRIISLEEGQFEFQNKKQIKLPQYEVFIKTLKHLKAKK